MNRRPPEPPHRLFAPHGKAEFSRQGQRLWGVAEGPFNLELAQEVHRRVLHWCRQLRADGEFDHLCEFRGSALASPEALRQLGDMLRDVAAEGLAPVRTAYVFPPDLEGGSLLSPLFERAFAATGLTMRVFASQAEALDWLNRSQP
jgi:hypothetical protein